MGGAAVTDADIEAIYDAIEPEGTWDVRFNKGMYRVTRYKVRQKMVERVYIRQNALCRVGRDHILLADREPHPDYSRPSDDSCMSTDPAARVP